jgi:hypothetical protein
MFSDCNQKIEAKNIHSFIFVSRHDDMSLNVSIGTSGLSINVSADSSAMASGDAADTVLNKLSKLDPNNISEEMKACAAIVDELNGEMKTSFSWASCIPCSIPFLLTYFSHDLPNRLHRATVELHEACLRHSQAENLEANKEGFRENREMLEAGIREIKEANKEGFREIKEANERMCSLIS